MASLPDLIKSTEESIGDIKRRPFDRFALAPFMIWYGLQSKGMSKWPRRAMVAGGIFQLIYAWNDYRRLMNSATESPSAFLDVVQNETEVV